VGVIGQRQQSPTALICNKQSFLRKTGGYMKKTQLILIDEFVNELTDHVDVLQGCVDSVIENFEVDETRTKKLINNFNKMTDLRYDVEMIVQKARELRLK
jgi:hypothetical protein